MSSASSSARGTKTDSINTLLKNCLNAIKRGIKQKNAVFKFLNPPNTYKTMFVYIPSVFTQKAHFQLSSILSPIHHQNPPFCCLYPTLYPVIPLYPRQLLKSPFSVRLNNHGDSGGVSLQVLSLQRFRVPL